MYNWSVDEEKFKKEDPEGYEIWRLEQMVNYGQPDEKIDRRLLLQHWGKIKDRIDPFYREFLEFLLWPKKQHQY